MKLYEKPSIEVISMKTAENIADNTWIQTMYTRAAGNDSTALYSGYVQEPYADRYDANAINGSTM